MDPRPPRSILAALVMVVVLGGCLDLAPPMPGGDAVTSSESSAPPDASELASEASETPSEPDVPQIDDFEVRSMDGSGNNEAHPQWGAAGQPYRRMAPANYAEDGGPVDLAAPPRYISNRVFNDRHQNLFSDRGVTQWAWLWGQFIDHSIGQRDSDGDAEPLTYDASDPLEEFANDAGEIPFTRSGLVPGQDGAPEQANKVSSFIDAWNVYGGDPDRLEWLRDGPVDGDMSNNAGTLLSTDDGYLPSPAARPDVPTPSMEVEGRLSDGPANAVVAGDERANENMALTGVQTLFMREHNRIVAALPDNLDEQRKFDITRRVVGAELQFITYNEFLPAVGVDLPDYAGYDPEVDPTLSTEFATVGYRAHSMIHGEIEMEVDADRYTADQLAAFADLGVEVTAVDDEIEVAVPLNLAFAAPDLVSAFGLGPVLAGMAAEAQYRNDEQFDNQLRSVLFMRPRDDVDGLAACLDGPRLSECFSEGVLDLGAIDLRRATDHGIGSYNALREVYGLDRATSLTDVTGEDTDEFPDDPEIDADDPIDDPDIMDFVELRDGNGDSIPLDGDTAESDAVEGIRRSTLAARLKAIYGHADALDPYIGMVSEAHLPGAEFGELQLAIWTTEFQALRDGDRFFYANDPVLDEIEQTYGITFRRTLRDILLDNTDLEPDDLPDSVFFASEE